MKVCLCMRVTGRFSAATRWPSLEPKIFSAHTLRSRTRKVVEDSSRDSLFFRDGTFTTNDLGSVAVDSI